jgi:hypothetical protein
MGSDCEAWVEQLKIEGWLLSSLLLLLLLLQQ